MALNARLVVVGGEVKQAEIKLRLPSTIGRGRGATIMLPHPLVSRQHCELYETDGRLMVRDLGSLNGTFINNERISDAALPSGELLTVGAVTFRAVYETPEMSGPPATAGAAVKGKSRDTDSNGPLRSAGTTPVGGKAAAAVAAPEEPVEVDFNFDEPLTPVDEGAGVSTTATVREPKGGPKTEPKVGAISAAEKAQLAKTEPVKGKGTPTPSKPAATPSKPATDAVAPAADATPPAADKENKTVNFAAWDLDEKPDPKGESDDDFGDFLKSLEK
jgi:predicted component of type VI protein secretion system